jgi:hypothetical protein
MVDNADDTTRKTILAASTAVKLASNPDSDTESSKDESPVKTIAGADVELAQLPDEEFWSHARHQSSSSKSLTTYLTRLPWQIRLLA